MPATHASISIVLASPMESDLQETLLFSIYTNSRRGVDLHMILPLQIKEKKTKLWHTSLC